MDVKAYRVEVLFTTPDDVGHRVSTRCTWFDICKHSVRVSDLRHGQGAFSLTPQLCTIQAVTVTLDGAVE